MKTHIVRGEVIFPAEEALPTEPVDVTVYVEDVSRADAPSVVVGKQRFNNFALRSGGGGPLKFKIEIPVDEIDERRSYSVGVHVDHSKTGDVTKGDFISTESYPVLTRGYGKEARVSVKRI